MKGKWSKNSLRWLTGSAGFNSVTMTKQERAAPPTGNY